jgi:hypothetical protein
MSSCSWFVLQGDLFLVELLSAAHTYCYNMLASRTKILFCYLSGVRLIPCQIISF